MTTTLFQSLARGFFSALILATVTITLPAQAEPGLLWKIETPSGKQGYLFGTMHTDDKRITELDSKVTNALKESDAFLMETLPPNSPDIYLMPQGKLSDYLKEAEFDKVRELADFHSMHIEAAMRMKPWLLAVVFDLPKPQALYTQDETLAALARDNNKPIYGIEDAAEHFAALDELNLEEQLVMLRAVLKRTQKQKEKDFESLLKAYQKGDTSKIAALDEKITGGMLPKELWQKMRSKLIDERNEVMAERIKAQLEETAAFFAVGASHLAGDQGLVARLRNSGYKLTVVK